MKAKSSPKKSAKKRPIPSGQLRRSQTLATFGPGAMLDLPGHSVLVGGLDHWREHGRVEIHDARLAALVQDKLGLDKPVPMYTPPVTGDDPSQPAGGITCFVFPAWFLAQVDLTYRDPATGRIYRTRPLVHWNHLDGQRHYKHEGQRVPVVPVRFVQACRNGHISDIDWHYFVADGDSARGPLWMDEGGSGSDLSEIYVRCGRSGRRRSLGQAKLPESRVLGRCRGDRPWIGRNAREQCRHGDTDEPEWSRLLVRSASNAHFSQALRVISLPSADQRLQDAVDEIYEDELQYVDDLDDLERLRRKQKPKIIRALGDLESPAIWAEIQRRKSRLAPAIKKPKQAEIETLLQSHAAAGHEHFHAEARADLDLPPLLRGRVAKIVLCHRLREVQALIGFTRFDAGNIDVDGDLDLGVRLAALADEIEWVPAIDNPGEGVFIAFDPEAIDAWLARPPVRARGQELIRGFERWKQSRGITNATFPGVAYVMLHSLAHLLIQAVALECGYAAAAISERIYAGAGGYGVLLYTGTTGSEGTLGGLVDVGRRIERYLLSALDLGRLCSNDPICAQHDPEDRHEDRLRHGAACHGCLLIAEPSCEARNEFLDRALVVPTVDRRDAAFFADDPGPT
jgi:hypothetical protein